MVRAITFLLMLLPTTTIAQTNCAEREIVIHRLFTNYGETLSVVGLQSEQLLIEIWASVKSGSWTIIATQPNGISCIRATGQYFILVPAPIPGSDG